MPKCRRAAIAALRSLRLTPSVTTAQIGRSFRRAARHLYPDVDGLADALRRLTAAYTLASPWVQATSKATRTG
jgi:hypothetical protein